MSQITQLQLYYLTAVRWQEFLFSVIAALPTWIYSPHRILLWKVTSLHLAMYKTSVLENLKQVENSAVDSTGLLWTLTQTLIYSTLVCNSFALCPWALSVNNLIPDSSPYNSNLRGGEGWVPVILWYLKAVF